MISSGRRYIAIDISPLDYIYSDGINALVTLNKRAQETGGTLALVSPQPKVVGILQTAGVQSAMSVLSGEAELMGLSNGISSAAAAAGSAAQSEFESLRSEIGSVFGDDAPPSGRASAPPPPPPPVFAPPPPPPVYAPPPALEPPAYAPLPPEPETLAVPLAPAAPMELQPMAPPPTAPAFPPPSESFPSETMAFGELGGSSFGTLETPPKSSSFDDFDDDFGGKKKKKPKERFDDFDDDFGVKKKKSKDPFDDDFGGFKKKSKDPFDDDDFSGKKRFAKESFNDFGTDDNVFSDKKKGSPVGAIVVLIILLALGGGGWYFFGPMGGKLPGMDGGSSETAYPASADRPSGPTGGPDMSAPDIPVTTIEVETPRPMTYTPGGKQSPEDKKSDKSDPKQKSAPYPSSTTPSYSTPSTPSYSTPSTPSTPSYSSPSYSSPSYSDPAPAPSYSAPEPEPAPPPPPPKVEQVVVTSNPSGATVEVDGRRGGNTPYTFKPASWGDITITVSMNGYEKSTKTVEFEGGTLNVPFSLSRASAAPPPSQAPPAARPSAGPSGASIFIATLPPKAEVYIGGRLIGTSNEGELQVPTGTHEVRFVKDGVEKTETITFNPGKNPTRFVNLKQ
jgi:hypothetical protein